ncbi:hypothetical protein N0V95_002838 [Ascochyta clinopodiicola]|nr:hypothetical protein N0V95_002838 [Ascochyta clinopodiicola]
MIDSIACGSTNAQSSAEEEHLSASLVSEQPITPPGPSSTSEADPLQKSRCPLHRDEDDDESKCASKRLRKEEEENITSRLLDPTIISFSDPKARQRDLTKKKSKMIPSFFYRTFYETSKTLCSRVSKDTHAKHRERPDLKISPGNAFQAIGEPDFSKAVTKEGIERQLNWNKACDPSQWISVFNELKHATRRAFFHSHQSKRIGHRVSIATISTSGLVAATVSGSCESVWEIITQLKPMGKSFASNTSCHHVDIPVWVSKDVVPDDGSSITVQQFNDSGAELWLSIAELRRSNLKDGILGHKASAYIMAKGHTYEWLALGFIPESRIVDVMPWDGDRLHHVRGKQIVRSKYSMDNWIFDWDKETWRMDSRLYAFSKYQESKLPKAKINDIVQAVRAIENTRAKRTQNASGNINEPRRPKLSQLMKPVPRRNTTNAAVCTGTCTSCGCKCRSHSRREASI